MFYFRCDFILFPIPGCQLKSSGSVGTPKLLDWTKVGFMIAINSVHHRISNGWLMSRRPLISMQHPDQIIHHWINGPLVVILFPRQAHNLANCSISPYFSAVIKRHIDRKRARFLRVTQWEELDMVTLDCGRDGKWCFDTSRKSSDIWFDKS